MRNSTLSISEYQYLTAFRERFTPAQLRRAVAARRVRTRNRVLPLWLLLGRLITWFWRPGDNLPWLLRWFRPARTRVPSDPAVYTARGRLGWAPFRWLRRHVPRAPAVPHRDPTGFHHGRRLPGIDGTTLTVADTPANERAFGRPSNRHRAGGYPLIRVVAVCESGTHALVDGSARGYHRSENRPARRLWRRIPAGSLVRMGRNFHSFGVWDAVRGGAFDVPLRAPKGPTFPVTAVLPDGSVLSRVRPRTGTGTGARAIAVRVITYQWTDPGCTVHRSRVVTSSLGPAAEPADARVALYHARWEEGLAFGEVTRQLAPRATHVRARDPVRARAELDGLLLGHWVARWAMVEAARAAGVAPVPLSLEGALRVLRVLRARVLGTIDHGPGWWPEVAREIGREQLRARRNR